MINRRTFILGSLASTLAACYQTPQLKNQCFNKKIPAGLLKNPFYTQAWQDIDATQVWDSHVHLLGLGDANQSWINPNMQSFKHPLLYAQFQFYLNASCIDNSTPENLNIAFIQRLQKQLAEFPQGAKIMLMAFDYSYNEQGKKIPEQTPYYIANNYAAKVAQLAPDRFEWIASIHPYRVGAAMASPR
jgi:mannonate dehydratase